MPVLLPVVKKASSPLWLNEVTMCALYGYAARKSSARLSLASTGQVASHTVGYAFTLVLRTVGARRPVATPSLSGLGSVLSRGLPTPRRNG